MRRQLPIRLLTCGVLAGSASFALLLPGGIASAKGTKPIKEVCTTLSGNATSQTISGCTGSAVDGTSGTSVTNSMTGNSGTATLTFAGSGKTANESYSFTAKTGTKDHCAPPAGYSNIEVVKEKGTITGGTATDLVGGKLKGTVCAFSQNVGGAILVQNAPGVPSDL